MWRIYSTDQRSIRISTTIRKLFTSLWNSQQAEAHYRRAIVKVEYKNQEEIENFIDSIILDEYFTSPAVMGPYAELLGMKREAFEHEKEIRLIFNAADSGGLGPWYEPLNFRNVPFPVADIVDDVMLDPRITQELQVELEAQIQALWVHRTYTKIRVISVYPATN